MADLPSGATVEKMDGDWQRFVDDLRAATIRECVTWLAMHHADFKPEALAGEMARDMLPKGGRP